MGKKESSKHVSQMMVDPRALQAMYGTIPEEDEIDLLGYWTVIWKKRFFILIVSFLAAVCAAGYSLTLPDIYRAEALLAPIGGEGNKGGVLSTLGALGGLASVAGVSLGGSSSIEENIAVLKSREFIWGFVKDEKMMPILFEKLWDKEAGKWIVEGEKGRPTLWDAWRLLIPGGLINLTIEKDSGLVTLAVNWSDPELATIWTTKLIKRINTYLREQAIFQSEKKLKYLNEVLVKTRVEENRRALFELISAEQKQAMLANTQKDFAFRVIDPAALPDKKVKPKRSTIVILAAVLAGFLGVFFIFIQDSFRKRKALLTINGNMVLEDKL